MTGRPVAVTGLTGFIGRRLAPQLVRAGFRVRAILRRPAFAADSAIEPRIVPLNDPDGLAKVLCGVEAVVHLAGAVRGRTAADFAPANVEAVANLCAAAGRQALPPALLLVSSLAASRPQLSPYAASKRAGEQALLAHPHLDWTILRPPVVYGPGDKALTSLFKLMRRGLTLVPGNARQRLSFLHVDDLVAAILCWLDNPGRCRQGQFSIDDGTPDGYDWPAIAAAGGAEKLRVLPLGVLRLASQLNLGLSRLFGYAPMLTPGKVRELAEDRWLGGDGGYGAVTGWRPRHDLASGLAQTFAGREDGCH